MFLQLVYKQIQTYIQKLQFLTKHLQLYLLFIFIYISLLKHPLIFRKLYHANVQQRGQQTNIGGHREDDNDDNSLQPYHILNY